MGSKGKDVRWPFQGIQNVPVEAGFSAALWQGHGREVCHAKELGERFPSHASLGEKTEQQLGLPLQQMGAGGQEMAGARTGGWALPLWALLMPGDVLAPKDWQQLQLPQRQAASATG